MLTVKISWIKNPPAQTTITDTISIQSLTSEGWTIDEGITAAVNTLFSALDPATVNNVVIIPSDPTAGESTNYEVIFSADTDIPQSSYVVITLPPELSVSGLNAGGTTALDT